LNNCPTNVKLKHVHKFVTESNIQISKIVCKNFVKLWNFLTESFKLLEILPHQSEVAFFRHKIKHLSFEGVFFQPK